jgi:uncharacterized protein YecE (DUF72 family)
MEFGRVENINDVDYTFPDDDKYTTKLFKELKKTKTKPHIYVGCAKWGRPDWVGKIYPKGTKPADFLKHYVQHYNSIELNAFFYQLFPASTVEKWAALAGDDFRFFPKFTNSITHIRRLKNAEKDTEAFLQTVHCFGKKLGTSFIQLGDNFGPKHVESIHDYLRSLPRDFNVALELRSKDWFTDKVIVDETYHLMKELGVTSIITDTSGRRDVLHMRLTTPKAFIRYVGNGLHPTDYKRIDDWVERIAVWLDSGLQELDFFIHQHDELHSPELSLYMIEKLNKRCKLNLKAPQLINKPGQSGLFD